ncbi:MAG TPA: MCP four helix bundle domain-containing protein, partial [Gallionella sp.]|nr:MCP four helix bundle domain-containing protein [Gallionella sp.]
MFKTMKLGVKLGLGFGVVVLLLVATIALGLTNMSSMNDNTREITEDRFPKVDVSGNIQVRLMDNGRLLRNLLLVTSDEDIAKNINKINENRALNAEDMTKLDKMINTPKGREQFDIIKKSRDELQPKYDIFYALSKKDKQKAAEYLLKDYAAT